MIYSLDIPRYQPISVEGDDGDVEDRGGATEHIRGYPEVADGPAQGPKPWEKGVTMAMIREDFFSF